LSINTQIGDRHASSPYSISQLACGLLASDHHLYKSPAGAEKLCTSLRNRDIANVQKWDPNHATYVSDYNAKEISGLSNPDLVGSYDFHHKAPDPYLLKDVACGARLGYTTDEPSRQKGYATESAVAMNFRKVGEHMDEMDGLEWVMRAEFDGSPAPTTC
jgi:hypothetical protein